VRVDQRNETLAERALRQFPYGLYVIGASEEGSATTIIANWATQVSFSPPLVAIAIEADSRMRIAIERSGFFSINVLPSGAKRIAQAFANPVAARSGGEFSLAPHGTPFLSRASASIECAVRQTHTAGDHLVFIGEVLDAAVRGEGEVLTLKETGWHYKTKRR
jgi:flavin reductase (DIM6/NTAB) family NADH-FMN oxidoreductase RutF